MRQSESEPKGDPTGGTHALGKCGARVGGSGCVGDDEFEVGCPPDQDGLVGQHLRGDLVWLKRAAACAAKTQGATAQRDSMTSIHSRNNACCRHLTVLRTALLRAALSLSRELRVVRAESSQCNHIRFTVL